MRRPAFRLDEIPECHVHFFFFLFFSHAQMQQRYHSSGCYEEVTEVPCLAGLSAGAAGTRKVRHCNWVRFIRPSPLFTPLVNVVCSKIKGTTNHQHRTQCQAE
jgi:hypothetical protein